MQLQQRVHYYPDQLCRDGTTGLTRWGLRQLDYRSYRLLLNDGYLVPAYHVLPVPVRQAMALAKGGRI